MPASLAELATRFSISTPAMGTALMGIATLDQLEQAIAAVEKGPLPAAALTRIAAHPVVVRRRAALAAKIMRMAEAARNRTRALDRNARRIALIVASAFFIQHIDGAIINTSLPQMASSFSVQPVDINIGITAYLLSMAACIPLGGWIADRFGAKHVFATRDRHLCRSPRSPAGSRKRCRSSRPRASCRASAAR